MTLKAPNVLSVSNLSLKKSGREILRGIDFSLQEGDFLAVLGPNGAGKSMLLKVILGLENSSAGNVEMSSGSSGERSDRGMGYVPQVKTLDRSFPGTGIELVVTGIRRRWPWWISAADAEQARNALDKVNARHLANESLADLSGGELQRVYLARAIVLRPQVLVLDEPATGVDAMGEMDLHKLLDGFLRPHGDAHRRGTVIMVTHDREVAVHHASKVLLLSGQQIAFGESRDVLNEDNLRRAFGHMTHSHHMHICEDGHH